MKRTLRPATRVLCLALLWSLVSPARRAAAAELRIEWRAPAECPSASDLKARVMQLTAGAKYSSLLAQVEVTRVERDFRAHVVVRGPSGFGERRLEDTRCDALVDSVALLIALSIPTPLASDRGDGLALALSPQVRMSSGSLPRLAAGFGAAVALEASAFRLELHGAYDIPQSSTFAQTTIGGEFRSFSVGACICRLWRVGLLQAGPCVGVESRHIDASGFGGMTRLSGNTSWWGPSLRLLGRAQLLPAFGIQIAIEGMVAVTRPKFVFSDIGQLHRASAIALQLSVGPEVRF